MLRAAVVLLLLLLLPSAAHAEKRVALVIGNSSYRYAGELANPKNDATDMAAALRTHGFQVIDGFDLNKTALERKIREFANALQGAEVGVFFYAGHGLQVSGQNYIVPTDAQLTTVAALELEVTRFEAVQRIMESEDRTNILFFDACRDNPLARNLQQAMGTRSTAIGRGLAPVQSGYGTLISYSTQPGNVALDGTGRNSPFTGALLRHLSSSDEEIMGLLRDVRNDVMRETQRRQVPWEHTALTARFYFKTQPDRVSPVRPRPQSNQPSANFDSAALPAEQPAISTPLSGGMVRIGVAGPITGGGAALGAQLKNGVEQAVKDINAAGGILGQKIQVFVGDDRADPKEGVSVANKFVGDGVKFVVGHFHSGVTIPASEVYQENGILEITPAATHPKVTERNMWNMFRTSGRDDRQGSAAAGIIAARFKGKRVAFIHDKTKYGQGLAEDTRNAMNARGLKEIFFEGVDAHDTNYSGLVSKLKASLADLVFWGGLSDTGGQILRQMRDQGLSAIFMGGDGIVDDAFAAIVGPRVVGTLMMWSPDPRTNPANNNLVQVFRRKGFEPYSYTFYSYAAVQIIKQAAEQANSLDPKKIAAVMHSGKVFHTALGELSFDDKGDVTGYTVGGRKKDQYVLYVWTKRADGKIPLLKPIREAASGSGASVEIPCLAGLFSKSL